MTGLYAIIDLVVWIIWAIGHPREAARRLAVGLGGCAVGCLSMAVGIVAVSSLAGILALEGEAKRSFNQATLVVGLIAAAIGLWAYLRWLPERWRWRDEAAPAAADEAPQRAGAEPAPKLAELDARLAPPGPERKRSD